MPGDRFVALVQGLAGVLIAGTVLAVLIFSGLYAEPVHGLLPLFSSLSLVLFCLCLVTGALAAYGSRTGRRLLPAPVGNLPGWQLLLLLTLAAGLFCIPVLSAWSTGTFLQNNAGGLLPVFDAGAYYHGAAYVLDEGTLDAWNQRRPVTSLFLAFRLLLTGFDLRLSILLQAVLLGGIAVYAALAVSRTIDRLSGLVMFLALFSLSAFFLSENVSEPLGIFFGCLSFLLVVRGLAGKSFLTYLAGVFFFTVGFMIRPGPFLFFTVLFILAGIFFHHKDSFSWKHAVFTLLPAGLGVLLNQSLFWLFGDGKGLAFGNYAAILYGLAAGGKGWEQYLADFPSETATLPEGQMYAFIYQKSFALIAADPGRFTGAILQGYLNAPTLFVDHMIRVLTPAARLEEIGPVPLLVAVLVMVCLIGGMARFFIHSPRDDLRLLLSLTIVSTFLSLPFFFTDGGIRTLAVIFPCLALGITLSVLGWRSGADLKVRGDASPLILRDIAVPVAAGLLVLCTVFCVPVFGPALAETMTGGPPPPHLITCPENETSFTMRADDGMPFLRQMDSTDPRHTFSPLIRPEVFSSVSERMYLDRYYDLSGFMDGRDVPVLFYGYDPEYHNAFLVLSPDGVLEPEPRTIRFCAETRNTSISPGYRVYGLNASSLVVS